MLCRLGKAIALRKREQGMAQGEERLGDLTDQMIKAGRMTDVQRATTDRAYREEQYKVYGIGLEAV